MITACNVLAHVHDIHDVMRGINVLLADDGILVTENHDLAQSSRASGTPSTTSIFASGTRRASITC